MTSDPITSPDQPLFRPLTLGQLQLPNRVVMAPMTRARAVNFELAPTDLHVQYYSQRSSAGLIVTEATWVSRQAIGFINVPGIYNDTQTAAWRHVTEAVHGKGGRIFSQLGHVGAASHPDHFNGALPAGPSAINPGEMSFTPTGPKQTVIPRALTEPEIKQTIEDYSAAAANAKRAGFDGVEIHAAGPYLIPQFLHPRLNQRTDNYGGDFDRRARFLLEVITAVQDIWPDRTGIKLSPYWTSGASFVSDETTLADYDDLVAELSVVGLAYLHLVGPTQATAGGDNPFGPFRRYRERYDGTIIANSGFTQNSGNAIIEAGASDAVSYALPFVANPDLVERFAHRHPLSDADPTTLYAGGANGYADYQPAVVA
jgi:N-ethylmaleimide reductase